MKEGLKMRFYRPHAMNVGSRLHPSHEVGIALGLIILGYLPQNKPDRIVLW